MKTLEHAVLQIHFLAGAHIEDSLKESIELSNRIGCMVGFEFNGSHYCINPESDYDALIKEWWSDKIIDH